jgi:NAD(P)-dependent dehydrogenase (short-subunit alcohol dehydrogenase family)
MNRLDGKVALISGAARGIGAETARMMVEAGAKVLVGDILDEDGKKAVQSIGPDGSAVYVRLDVTREEDWTAAVSTATSRFGGLDILVNNAGVFVGKGIEDSTLADWQRLCAINMTGVFLGTKLALPALRERAKTSKHGSAIVNLSSIAGIIGYQADPLYSMSKGGVTTFTKSAALEFARKGYRIRVNSIHPGLIETEMTKQSFEARVRSGIISDVEAARKSRIEAHPIGRLGTPTDIANGIVFLASDDAGFMTGSSLIVDGGNMAQ